RTTRPAPRPPARRCDTARRCRAGASPGGAPATAPAYPCPSRSARRPSLSVLRASSARNLEPQAAALREFDEVGERSGDILAALDPDRAARTQCSDCERHGDAVIVMGLNHAAAELASDNDDAVRCRRRLDSQRMQSVSHYLNAVAFLDAQFFGAAQNRSPLGTGRSDKQR